MQKMTAEDILAIKEDQPELLFDVDPSIAKSQRKTLLLQWHSDRNSDQRAKIVAAHINALFDKASEKRDKGEWQSPGLLILEGRDGTIRKIKYRKSHSFELGKMYYGNGVICYILDKEHKMLFENMNKMLNFKYANDKMKKEFTPLLPNVLAKFETKDGRWVVVVKKLKGVYLLKDVIEASDGQIDPKHVAWIVNCIYNICCFLNYNGICHNALSMDTIFISPETHSGYLLGGWWYSSKVGTRLKQLPALSYNYSSNEMKRTKQANLQLDATMVRIVARQMLGDVSGMKLTRDKRVPKAMVRFLKTASNENVVEDYAHWHGPLLKECFGARRFVKMNITDSDIFD